ncbi:MAG: hypothetical protein QXX09_03345 [Candidatus Methanomethylicia archaeon]
MEEIKILNLRKDDKIIQLTDKYFRVVEGPFIDRYSGRRVGVARERWFAREEYQLLWEIEIPIEKIVKMDYENGKLKILWMKKEKERYEKPEEYELRLMEYEATPIINIYNRLRRKEDPIILAKEYSQSFIGYREEVAKGNEIISIEGEYVKIEGGEMNRLLSFRYIVPHAVSTLRRVSEVYTDKIPINEIKDTKIEIKERSGEKEYHAKIILKNNKVKDINFYNEELKAKRFIETLNKILETTIKGREEKVRYEIQYKKPEYATEEGRLIKTSLRSILPPAVMIFLILATLTREYVGKDLATMILALILSFLLAMIWRKIRG